MCRCTVHPFRFALRWPKIHRSASFGWCPSVELRPCLQSAIRPIQAGKPRRLVYGTNFSDSGLSRSRLQRCRISSKGSARSA
ncbi:hypothetical protein KIN20_035741 [Parelaphostrongylus tenuis]|uniref:Uncharacterized protein n=1 Tax=Parelaphostrongylus tenuis TaxID=148309 RepID=A0AAD5RF35_PARTN|nr:hypothetical protein KIN20_035741 [Parelaphostrongylus tenuis]